ncbi:hypothetical protein ScPMuIL_014467 [Solemya velum]
MAAFITSIRETYDGLMSYADPRTDDWFMIETPFPTIGVLLLYFCMVKYGPMFMKNRKALDLKYPLIVYNFTMVVVSFYMFYQFMYHQWFNNYAIFGCQAVDYSDSPNAIKITSICWFFFMTKFIELADTAFFILRKKNNQISFLHVFHHGFLPFSWWIGVRFFCFTFPGGMGTFHAMVNASVHTVMYTYYGLSAIGPHMQKYLWWKKYITQIQILQFVIVCIHTSPIFFKECAFPFGFAVTLFIHSVVFLLLFLNFYIKAYRKTTSKESKALNGVQKNGVVTNEHSNGYNKAHSKIQNGHSHSNGKILNGFVHTNGIDICTIQTIAPLGMAHACPTYREKRSCVDIPTAEGHDCCQHTLACPVSTNSQATRRFGAIILELQARDRDRMYQLKTSGCCSSLPGTSCL